MANYDVPWWSLSRLGYFGGEPLFDQDMVDEQTWLAGNRQRAMRLLRTAGVAEGFAITTAGLALQVSPGTAFDVLGNAIVLAPNNPNAPDNPALPPSNEPNNHSAPPWTGLPSGAWQRVFPSGAASNVPLLLYVRFDETECEQSSTGAAGNTRLQQTPILDVVNGDAQAIATLAQSQALLLAVLTLSDTAVTVTSESWSFGAQTIARQTAGLSLPGPSLSVLAEGAIPTASSYLRVASDAALEIGGTAGLALGTVATSAVADPSTGAVPLAPQGVALVIGSDDTVTFAQPLTTTAVTIGGTLDVDSGLLHATPSGAVTIQGELDVAAGALHVAPGTVSIGAPSLQLPGGLGQGLDAASGGAFVLATPLDLSSASLGVSAADGTPVGAVQSTTQGATPTLAITAPAGVALGTSPSSPSLTVNATAVTTTTPLAINGDLSTGGTLDVQQPITLLGRITTGWSAQLVIDPTLQFSPTTNLLTSRPFVSRGGALVLTVVGNLTFCADPNGAVPPSLQFTVSFDGKALPGTWTTPVIFWSNVQVLAGCYSLPLTRLVLPAPTPSGSHTLTLQLTTTLPPLGAFNGLAATLSAVVMELPVSTLGGST